MMLLEEISRKTIEAVICRAPEFYGDGKTQSVTNSKVTTYCEGVEQIMKEQSSRN